MEEFKYFFIEQEIEELPPERNLLAALLDRAIRDSFGSEEQAINREIKAWFNKPLVNEPRPFSYQWVCEALDLDPIKMRQIIKTLDIKSYRIL